MIKIVYCSKTGFSKQYAEIIEKETGIGAVDIKKLKKSDKGLPIFYVGSVMVGKIRGLKKALENYNILGVLAVGMEEAKNDTATTIQNNNEVAQPVFYAQGGFDLTKLKGLSRFVLKSVLKENAKRRSQDPAEQKSLISDALLPKNFVKKENIESFISLIDTIKLSDN